MYINVRRSRQQVGIQTMCVYLILNELLKLFEENTYNQHESIKISHGARGADPDP